MTLVAMLRSSAILSLLCLLPSPAFAQSKDVSYRCAGEAAAGLWYNEQTKKWEGASFRPQQQFVLKLKFVRARENVSDYGAIVTTSGKDTGLPCTTTDTEETVTVVDSDRSFSCTTVAYDYVFNLSTNRFLSMYVYGYMDGKDSNDNTPVVEGGTCTKID